MDDVRVGRIAGLQACGLVYGLLWFVGCGPGGGTTEAASEGASSGDVGDAGESVDGDDDAAESGSEAECEDLFPPPPPFEPEPIEVLIENEREEPIFVLSPGGCEFGPIRVQQGGVDVRYQLGGCDLRCLEAIGSDICGCTYDCAPPPVVRIEPGAAYTYVWGGWVYRSNTVPGECLARGTECVDGLACFEPEVVGPQPYDVLVSAVLDIDRCYVDGEPSTCECDDPSGWCLLETYGWDSEVIEASGQLDEYPADTAVQITFD